MKVYTVGYGNRSPGQLLDLLIGKGIKRVDDVRLRPDKAHTGSFVKAKSNDKGIEALLNEAGIAYTSFVELGNVFMDYTDWRERYETLLLCAGDLLTERLAQMQPPLCLLCSETRASDCHREYIATYLAQRGWEVEHIE
jgi:uncharacterized protein (DUF488 family)